jgi:hypothetical protein
MVVPERSVMGTVFAVIEVRCARIPMHEYTACCQDYESCRYAALMMPLNVAPAVACIVFASMQETSILSLIWVWTGLALVMLMRAVTIWLPFTRRAWMFKSLPPDE